jgi:hypothetical protein
MSHDKRISLMDLKKPLAKPAEPAVPVEEIERQFLRRHTSGDTVMPQDIPPTVPSAVQTAVQVDVPPSDKTPPPRSRLQPKQVTIPATFRLPLALHDRLKSVAQFNRLNMTDIVAEAIEIHLANFPHPPAPAGKP